MAVNLKATASLNVGPFMKGLTTIRSGLASLDKTTTKSVKASGSAVLAEAAAREKAAKQVARSTNANTTATRSSNQAMREGAVDADRYKRSLLDIYATQGKLINRLSKMTAAQQAQLKAVDRYNKAVAAQATAYGQGLEGPAYDKLAAQTRAASEAVANANRRVAAEAAKASTATDKAATAQRNLGKAIASTSLGLSGQRYLYQDVSRQAGRAALGLAAFPALAIGFSTSWERLFSNVERTADPAFSNIESKVKGLRNSLVGMAQAMPTTFTEITDIATLGNQMGVAAGQIAEFTRAVAMFSATSGVGADIAATAFGRLTSILGTKAIPFMDMADAILKVGVNSVATEGEIINVNTQISSIAAQAGFSAKEMIALSGALASVRVPPELSRGLITRVFGQIDKAVAGGGTSLDTLARISGRTAEQFKQEWGSDGAATLFNDFLRGLKAAGSDARSELESIGIRSVRDLPVTLRLANAADSQGNVGELFTQTLRDANNAAGETQRQYTIMAETVVGKLKILGNNVAAFFDAAGQSSLGGFGELLDDMSTGLRNFTRDIDEPAKLLNTLELPFSNAELVGSISKLTMYAAGLALIVSGYAKFRAAATAIKQFGGAYSIGTIMGNASGAWGNFNRSVKAGNGVMASFARTSTTTAQAMSSATTRVGQLGASIRGATNLVGGPWVAALAAAAAAAMAIHHGMQFVEQDTKGLAEKIASVDITNMREFDAVLASITAKRNWGPESNPFADSSLADRVAEFSAGMERADEIANSTMFGAYSMEATWGAAFQELGTKAHTFSAEVKDALGTFDTAFQDVVDSGNASKAVDAIQKLAKNGTDLQNVFDQGATKNMEAYLKNAFMLADVDWTEANLTKFLKGQLNEVTDAIYGTAGATKILGEMFEGDSEQLGDFAAALDDGAASFINFTNAVSANTKTNEAGEFLSFDLGGFNKSIKTQISDQEKWMEAIVTISQHGSSEVVQALGAMGVEGQHAAVALAEGLAEGSPLALETLATLEEAVVAGVGGFGNTVAEAMANIAWASKITGSDDLARALQAMLGDDKLSSLYDAAESVGEETAGRILQGLARGDISYDEAIGQLLAAQPLVKVDVEIDDAAAERGLQALKRKLFDTEDYTMDVSIDTSTTVRELRGLLDDPTLNEMKIDGSLTLTEAYAKSREFQLWAQANGVDMLLGANDAPARLSVAALTAFANGQIAQVQIDALPTLAEGQIWDIVQQADGTTAFISMNADGTPAESTLKVVVDKVGNTVSTLRINGDASGVRSTISQFDGRVVGTAFINIQGRGMVNASSALNHEQAYGGILQTYAKGGVREDHRPQIAPAGAMRLWAEPETDGEAYIPFAKDRRKRAVGILDTVASRFGYALTKQADVAQYANGGTYELQSRLRYGRMRNNGVDSNSIERSINFTFHNPVERNWAEDAWEKAQLVGARL